MRKRGLTLIELMVAMTIFVTVMTLSVGGFVAISKSRATIGTMKETQQKVRIANEMIVRYAKQADYVKISTAGDTLDLYFDFSSDVLRSAKRFELSRTDQDLVYYECKPLSFDPISKLCTDWSGSRSSLLGGNTKGVYLNVPASGEKVFSLSGVVPSVLSVILDASDNLRIENAIILGGLK